MKAAKSQSYLLFPAPVAVVQYEEFEETNQRILAEVSAVDWDAHHQQRGLQYEVGHTRAEDTFITRELVPSCQQVLDAFVSSCNQFAQHLCWDIDPSGAQLTAFWAHITPPGEFTTPHRHLSRYKTNHLSGVYYVRTPPGCGEISFSDDRLVRAYEPLIRQPEKAPYTLHQGFRAREGLMIIFPSWLTHRVAVNKAT